MVEMHQIQSKCTEKQKLGFLFSFLPNSKTNPTDQPFKACLTSQNIIEIQILNFISESEIGNSTSIWDDSLDDCRCVFHDVVLYVGISYI